MNNICEICHIKEADFAEHINSDIPHMSSSVSYCIDCWLLRVPQEETNKNEPS